MHLVHIRSAGFLDAAPMAVLLNAIIKKGGTTAITRPVDRGTIRTFMRHYSGQNAWSLAEDSAGEVLGFQFIEPKESLPNDTADIATFVKIGKTGLGVGSKLFERTRTQATKLGYRWINATIRCDNTGGLAYYKSRGFEPYSSEKSVVLEDGTQVDRINTRFEL